MAVQYYYYTRYTLHSANLGLCCAHHNSDFFILCCKYRPQSNYISLARPNVLLKLRCYFVNRVEAALAADYRRRPNGGIWYDAKVKQTKLLQYSTSSCRAPFVSITVWTVTILHWTDRRCSFSSSWIRRDVSRIIGCVGWWRWKWNWFCNGKVSLRGQTSLGAYPCVT